LKHACELDLEGIVSKRADAPYVSDRNPDWTKVPCKRRDTFRVVGWAEKDKKFDGLYLGIWAATPHFVPNPSA
jgi:bifunctional non-homologous end joining protein LigD